MLIKEMLNKQMIVITHFFCFTPVHSSLFPVHVIYLIASVFSCVIAFINYVTLFQMPAFVYASCSIRISQSIPEILLQSSLLLRVPLQENIHIICNLSQALSV